MGVPEKILNLMKNLEEGYTVVRILGKGSIGTVYECRNSSSKSFAVKIMETTPMMDPSVFDGIVDAAEATSKLSRDIKVVHVFSAGKIEQHYYIIMEMMHGGTLEKFIGNPDISFEEKLRIASQTAETIYDIHSRGILHGDLKPENILMSLDSVPYLNDFYLYPARANSNVMPNMPLGTPFYMSPEQAKGASVTPQSDIYSFGVLTYELLTGRMPYTTKPDNIRELIKKITAGEIVPPEKVEKSINSKLSAVMLKLLAKTPEKRYRNMREAADDIKACIENRPVSVEYKHTLLEKITLIFQKNS